MPPGRTARTSDALGVFARYADEAFDTLNALRRRVARRCRWLAD